jgi:hypothetical protein
MTADDLSVLKDHIDRVVTIDCMDGEVLTAKVLVVSEEDEDIIFDLVSTNRQDKYEKLDRQPAYLLRFQHITHVEPARN